MGKVKGKHRLDKYYHLAKEHGYRSRAAWKLVQLDSKHSFLRSSRSVLDLCAAPGGWLQVCVERVPVGSLLLGVDLDPIRPIRGAMALQEDITSSRCRASVKRIMAENGVRAFDLVLHDGSPNVGGAWAKEATTQNALVIDSVKLAADLLAPKGTFVTKVFRSQDYSAVLYCLRQLFERVEVDKPLASRSASAEIYIIGFKYKAPAKIDPRLLDFKHLFQGGVEPPKVLDVLGSSQQKRNRDGYEEGLSTMHKVSSAADFVFSDKPLDILGTVSSINFGDVASLPIKDHSSTTEEVKALCDDLRVLGKQDFKHLLKWRMQIRKALQSSEKTEDLPTTDVAQEEIKVDEEERLLTEMEELSHAIERKKKRDKKLVAKRRAKDKAKKLTGMQVDATLDGYGDDDLFSLTSIKGKNDLVAVDNNEFDDEADAAHNSDSEEEQEKDKGDLSSDIDSEEERRRYDERMEELLDDAYEQYLSRTEGSTRQKKRTKQAHKDDQGDEDLNGDIIPSGHDSDSDRVDEKNPLVVPLEDVQTQEQIKAQWFSQDVFAEADEHEDINKYDSDDEMQVDESVEQSAMLSKKLRGEKKKPNVSDQGVQPSKAKEEDFEIVPAPNSDSSDSSSDESEIDDVETKAEILAYAKKMLRKKQREEILDDSYNRYMFHDDGLPNWFVDDEKKHHQPMKPITKEEVNAMKAQFKDIDARPVKKVAEAKARKKRVAYRKLEKVRKKANTISDQADISDRSKSKMIESLYSKATKENRPKKEYVVAKKGVKVKVVKGQVLVDPRMKKDVARANNRSKPVKGKGKGGPAKSSAKGRGGPAKSPAKGRGGPAKSPAKGRGGPAKSPAKGRKGGNRPK